MANRGPGYATTNVDARVTSLEGQLPTTLTSAGGTETLVQDGLGPALGTKGLTAGAGITLTPSATDITIVGAAVATLTSAGGTETLVQDGVGPTLATKGLTAGAGVSLTGAANDVTIANTDPGSAVALTTAGGTESLVQDGAGPALATKGLTAGTGITLTPTATDITITGSATTTLASAGGTETLVQDGTGPTLASKGLTAGTGISLVGGGTDVTIANTDTGSAVTLSSAGGTETLVQDGTGPTLATKGVTAGAGILLTPTATDLTISTITPQVKAFAYIRVRITDGGVLKTPPTAEPGSFNVFSVVHVGLGLFRINFATALSGTNYTVVASGQTGGITNGCIFETKHTAGAVTTTSSFGIRVFCHGTGALVDPNDINIVVHESP